MPIPDMTGLPPFAQQQDLIDKINMFVQQYNNLMLSLDSLNVVSLTADNIDAGTLNAALVTVRAALIGSAYILINAAQGLVINDGTKDTFHADISGLVTMVGALIKSATGYPRVEMNSSDNIFAAYQTAGDGIKITPVYQSGPPAILFDAASVTQAKLILSPVSFGVVTSGTTNLSLQSAQDIKLSSNGVLTIDDITAFSGTFDVVADVNFGSSTVDYTRVTVRKGIITKVAAV